MNKIDKIYVINVPKAADRLQRIKTLLKEERISIPIEYVKATYWKDAEFEKLVSSKTIAPHKNWEDWFAVHNDREMWQDSVKMNLGQMACCYSHLKVLEQIRDRKETALILQDDCFWEKPGQLQYEIDCYHDLILQHNDFGIYYIGRSEVWDDPEKAYKKTEFLQPNYSWNAHAFIISHISCDKILNDKIFKQMIPFDEYLPICWGKSPYIDEDYAQYNEEVSKTHNNGKLIDAVSSPRYDIIFQGNETCVCPRDKVGKEIMLNFVNSDIGESGEYSWEEE